MKPQLIDAHTHIQFSAYDKDSAEVIKRALDKSIWLVNVGTQKDTSVQAIEMANNYSEGVYATVGLHPIHTEASFHDKNELGIFGNESKEFTSRGENLDYDFYKKIAQDKKVVAIGECGMDYYRLTLETKEKQKEVLIKQIELANEVKKPLMIHCRNAFPDLISILNSNIKILNSPPGIIHFFSGSLEDAKKLLELGFSFSFGGVITFTRDYDEVIKNIPIDRILLETDAPYVTPVPYRGKRNEPSYVDEVAKKLAEIEGLTFEEIAEITTKNALKVFDLE